MPNMHGSTHRLKITIRLLSILILSTCTDWQLHAQQNISLPDVSELKWTIDQDVLLKLANDSSYTFDIRGLFHVADDPIQNPSEFILFPVTPGEEFINQVLSDSVGVKSSLASYKTLWSALHAFIHGGWVHFNNCLLYAFETGHLSLTSPFMKRPETTWKPKPVTESYLRTRKWEYYTPTKQKAARKEYEIRKSKYDLGDLASLPPSIVSLFLETSDKELQHMKQKGDTRRWAEINLVKLMLGMNYLSEPQILYIQSAVLNAIKNYSASMLPAIIIFDKFNAAAVMNLSSDGYRIEAVAFKNAEALTASEAEIRKSSIQQIVNEINNYNQQQFIKRLGSYYRQ